MRARPSALELLSLAVEQIKDDVPAGYLPAATLARKIGLPYQRVYRWFKPAGGPDAEGVLALLDAFGWLSIPEDGRAVAESPRDLPEAVVRGLAVVAANLGLVLDALGVPEDARRRLEDPPAPPQAVPKRRGA